MAEAIAVSAQRREIAGKGAARAERKAGRIPAIIYGDKKTPLSISVDGRDLKKLYQSPRFFTQIFVLQVDGEKHEVLARDLQLHPVTDGPIHIDFMRVKDTTKVTVEVPVDFLNRDKCPGLKLGGVLNAVRRKIELVCLRFI